VNERQPESEEARPVALANAPSKVVADQCQTVKTRKRNYRCVLTWFASRWRNHQPKRAEKPHSKVNAARRWPALLRGRKELRLPWRIASGSWQPPRGERLMPVREREHGELPSPICPCLTARLGRDFSFCGGSPHPKPCGGYFTVTLLSSLRQVVSPPASEPAQHTTVI
jgi:hypothetical protein